MTSGIETVVRESAESIKRFLAVAALLGATTPLAGQTPSCSEPHYRWSEKTDASLASVTPKRAFISTILKTWTPLALTGQALYTCAPRSSRELETYSVTGWVRYLEKHESDGDWHLELTRGSDSPRDSCLVVEIPPTLPDGLYGLARADLDRLLAGAPVTAAGEVTAPVRLRVIGTAFFDGEHRGGPDRRDQTDGSHGHCNLSARALWEIHPVYWVRPP